MADLKKLHLDLCMTSVFRTVLDKPLFKYFDDYASLEVTKDQKISAYASLVSEVYKLGGSLTDAVMRLVFEDENVYVKSRARGSSLDENIIKAAERELENAPKPEISEKVAPRVEFSEDEESF